MRIGVIGAGAIGGTLAALCDRDGHEVILATRNASATRRSLHLQGTFGEHTCELEEVAQLPGEVDIVICATKLGELSEALHTNRAGCFGSPVLCIQNGIRGPEIARQTLGPRARILHGLASFAAYHDGQGTVTVTGGRGLVVGASTGTRPTLAEAIVQVLPQVIGCSVSDDIESAMWSKLLVNQLNALPAITNQPMQEIYAHENMAFIAAQAMLEVYELGLALGRRFPVIPLFDEQTKTALNDASTRVVAAPSTIVRSMVATFGDVPNLGSTLQSLRRGVPSENAALGKDPLELASSHGMTLPSVQLLTELVEAREHAAQPPLTPDEVQDAWRKKASRA